MDTGIFDWAVSVKPDLVRLQNEQNIPALFAAAQFCHESYNTGTGGLSELASRCHNYAGMKYASWQAEYGATPVVYGTWEHINGTDRRVSAAFASFPSWEAWLKAYAALLDFDRYRGAKAYAYDPLLYAYKVWRGGWATDPAYLSGVGHWMEQLWPYYADTIPQRPVERPEVLIVDAAGNLLAEGWLDGNDTVVKVRQLAEAQGQIVEWKQEGDMRKVILRWPGAK